MTPLAGEPAYMADLDDWPQAAYVAGAIEIASLRAHWATASGVALGVIARDFSVL
jgi:hypothetical protein